MTIIFRNRTFCADSMIGLILTVVACTWPCSATPLAQDEKIIQCLIGYIRDSKLIFIRNGQEHDSVSGADHISSKYAQLKNGISSPEDFIDRAASKSMMSGQPYLVKFPDGSLQEVSNLLRVELKRCKAKIEIGS